MMVLGENERSKRIIAKWVFIGVAMILVQVLIGGITRLTGSGLSITEWKPIMGFLPPMNETEWQQAFEKYKSIAQYKYINNHFGLGEFKFIFFWEWFHRLWARLIAVAFAIPFIYFLIKGIIKKEFINALIILVLLGALEGAIGWIMVKSGLNDEDIYVNHIKLSVHFVFAMIIVSYAVVFGTSLLVKSSNKVYNPSLKKLSILIVALLGVQLMYGAFMAGLKAANAASTWPLINGMILPNTANGFVDFLFFNKLTIHFMHRTLAYILTGLLIYWWLKAKKETSSALFNKTKNYTLILVIFQVVLGVSSILLSPKIEMGNFGIFEWAALLHQLVGMLLLLSLMVNIYLLRFKPNNSNE